MAPRQALEPIDLLQEFPRSSWPDSSPQEPTSRLLLSRHGGFRHRVETLLNTSRAALNDTISPPDFTYELARELHFFVPLLEGHHQAESARLYPRLIQHYPTLQDKFLILERDHTDIDKALSSLAKVPERLMTEASTKARFHQETERLCEELHRFQEILERHLDDEEDLVIPILLKLNLSLDL